MTSLHWPPRLTGVRIGRNPMHSKPELLLVEPPDYEQAMRDFLDLPPRIDALIAEAAELRERFRVARTTIETLVRNTAAAACGRVK